MKRFLYPFIATLIVAVGVSGCKSSGSHDIPSVDLTAALADTAEMSRLKVVDVAYTPLDTTTAALLDDQAAIAGIIGDTLLVRDFNSVKLFSLSNGELLGNISHVGNGPGEYTWIEKTFLDVPAGQIVIKGAGDRAHRYTFTDRLIESYPVQRFYNRRLAIGSLSSGIYILEPQNDGDVIRVLDSNFNLTDSILLPDYNLGYYAGIFSQDGERSLVSMADTVYEIKPEGLTKVLITDRHGRYISPEKERVFDSMGNDRWNAQSSYINFFSVLSGDNYMIIPVSVDNMMFTLIFDKTDGTLLSRIPAKGPADGLPAEWNGVVMPAYPQYYSNGRFYAIVGEEFAVGPNGEPNDGELNSGVISFRLER